MKFHLTNLTPVIDNFVQTKLLKAEQKLTIINQYIWPGLIYPLQCAPLTQLSDAFVKNLNKIIKSSVERNNYVT